MNRRIGDVYGDEVERRPLRSQYLSCLVRGLGLCAALLACETAAPATPEPGWFGRSDLNAMLSAFGCENRQYSQQLGYARAQLQRRLASEATNPYVWIAFAELGVKRRAIGEELSLDLARKAALDALRIDSSVPEGHAALARVLIADSDPAGAFDAIREAEAKGASPGSVLLLRAQLASRTGQFEKAVTHLESASKGDVPGFSRATVYELLGEAQTQLGNTAAAEQSFRAAVNAKPCSEAPYLRLAGILLHEKGFTAEAEQILRDTYEKYPMPEVKRAQAGVDYWRWAQNYRIRQTKVQEGRVIAQSSFLAPEEAFVEAAAYRRGIEVLRALQGAGIVRRVDVRDEHGYTALAMAAKANQPANANYLLDARADANAETAFGERPIGFFAAQGNSAAVSRLLLNGADPDYRDLRGESPLSLALLGGHEGAFAKLLGAKKAFAKVDLVLLLTRASGQGRILAVKALVAKGVNMNGSTHDFFPPLIAAIVGRHVSVVEFLLANGADPRVSFAGRAADEWARDTLDPGLLNAFSQARRRSL